MKKVIALLLTFSVLFCLAGCKKNKNNGSAYGIDINYYLGAGQISEAKYGLGLNPDEIEKDAEAQSGEHTHEGGDGHAGMIFYEDFIGKEAYVVDGFYYCFKTGEEEKGISCIIGTDTIYGFAVGMATKFEVNEAISNLSPQATVSGNKDFFYLLFDMDNVDTLVCKNGKNVLKFYFEEDILIAACLYDSEKWEF